MGEGGFTGWLGEDYRTARVQNHDGVTGRPGVAENDHGWWSYKFEDNLNIRMVSALRGGFFSPSMHFCTINNDLKFGKSKASR